MIIKYDISKLKSLIKNLKKKVAVQVGIFPDKTGRYTAPHQDPTDNATLGRMMELGFERIPARSWLEMPLKNHFKSEGKDVSKEMINGDIKEVYNDLIGKSAVKTINEAFETGGFGEWDKNSKITIMIKKSKRPLIDTGQLKDAVSSKVVGKR